MRWFSRLIKRVNPRYETLDEQYLRLFYTLKLYFEIKQGWPGFRTEIQLPERPYSGSRLALYYEYFSVYVEVLGVDQLIVEIRNHEKQLPGGFTELLFGGELTRVGMHAKLREIAPEADVLRWSHTHPAGYMPWVKP